MKNKKVVDVDTCFHCLDPILDTQWCCYTSDGPAHSACATGRIPLGGEEYDENNSDFPETVIKIIIESITWPDNSFRNYPSEALAVEYESARKLSHNDALVALKELWGNK